MPEIGDVMDVNIDDLTPKQQVQLKDATDQFQMKCLMLFGKNRSGVPYLKSEMPRVLLPGEPDTTSFSRERRGSECFSGDCRSCDGKASYNFLEHVQADDDWRIRPRHGKGV
jgi:hypothetical protein